MGYRIAGIDVHKRLLAVVVAVAGEFQFERRTIGTSPDQLRTLADWPLRMIRTDVRPWQEELKRLLPTR